MSPSATAGPRRRWGVIFILAALVGGALAWHFLPGEQVPTPPEIAIAVADPLLADSAHAARERVLREPRSAAAWGEYGKLLFANEHREPARTCFAQAERLDANEPRWPYLHGRSLLPADPDAALPHLRRAAELADQHDRDNPAPHWQLGHSLLVLGRIDEADAPLKRAHSIDSDSPVVQFALALEADARGDAVMARQHLGRCLEHPSTRQKAHSRLAAIARQQNQIELAAQHSARAESLPQDQPWPDPYLLECQRLAVGKEGRAREIEFLERQGRFREAAVLLDEVLRHAPDATTYVQLANNLTRLGDLTGTEQALQSALKLNPNSATVHLRFAELHRLRGLQAGRDSDGRVKQFTAAVASARAAIQASPLDGYAQQLLGLCLKQLGDGDGALEALRTAVRLGPGRAEPLMHLADAEFEAKLFDDAKRHVDEAAQLVGADDPLVKFARQRLAELRK